MNWLNFISKLENQKELLTLLGNKFSSTLPNKIYSHARRYFLFLVEKYITLTLKHHLINLKQTFFNFFWSRSMKAWIFTYCPKTGWIWISWGEIDSFSGIVISTFSAGSPWRFDTLNINRSGVLNGCLNHIIWQSNFEYHSYQTVPIWWPPRIRIFLIVRLCPRFTVRTLWSSEKFSEILSWINRHKRKWQ